MKRSLWLLTGLAVVLGLNFHDSSRGQVPGTKPGDIGPGDQGAKLRLPGMDAPLAPTRTPTPGSGLPSSVQNLFNPLATPMGSGPVPLTTPVGPRIAQLPATPTDINKDIEITADVGQWMLLLKAYTGTEAPTLARALVIELRNNYNIKAAYIFNYGAEEKRQEYERVRALQQKQVDDLAKAGLKGGFVPIPIRAAKIEEQTGVLIGGFRSRDEALAALPQVRNLKAPDPVKFKLDLTFVAELERDKKGNVLPELRTKGLVEGGLAYVNPFSKAFPVRNPSIKHDSEKSQMSAEELAVLRKINKVENEEFSLFTCRSKYTLVVKQFNTQFKIGSEVKAPAGWFEQVFSTKQTEWQDNAAHNAHNLAKGFRKTGLPETYVLHTRFCSFVTVGGFDSPEDRRLTSMQELLETRFRSDDAYRRLEMMPRPVPMIVPH